MHATPEAPPSLPVHLPDPTRGYVRSGPVVVRATQRARVAGALALLAGFVALLLDAARVLDEPALVILLGSWAAAVAVYLSVFLLSLVGRPRGAASLLALEVGAGSAAERNALVLPLVAVSLVGPLTLHGVVASLLGCGPGHLTFDDWVLISLLVVGHAHVVLAVLAGRDGARLADGQKVSARRTLLWTAVTAGVPGVLLYAIPPVLTALTGAVLIPTMYAWARRTLAVERRMAAG